MSLYGKIAPIKLDRIYCKTCNENICYVCVIGHSGHDFCEQKYSVDLVNQKLKDTISKFQTKLDEVVTLRSNNSVAKDNIQGHKKEKLTEIGKVFLGGMTKIRELLYALGGFGQKPKRSIETRI
jgi:hypothetical protein